MLHCWKGVPPSSLGIVVNIQLKHGDHDKIRHGHIGDACFFRPISDLELQDWRRGTTAPSQLHAFKLSDLQTSNLKPKLY
jgi:hypothetical protein